MADPGRSTGRLLFDQALAGGAQATGVSCGLSVGATADIVALDGGHISLEGRFGDAVLDSWIFGAPRGGVASVWRAGRLVVRQGRHVARDAIAKRFRKAMMELTADW
mgnify:CR=1 FL=1